MKRHPTATELLLPTRPIRDSQSMDVALLAEGTYPFHPGGVSVWCDQLVRGLTPHRFSIHAITAGHERKLAWELPDNVDVLHSIPLWSPASRSKQSAGDSAEIRAAFAQLAMSMVEPGGGASFVDALHQLFSLSQQTSLVGSLGTKESLAVLLDAMRLAGPGHRSSDVTSKRDPAAVTVGDGRVALDMIEHQLRPLFAPPPEADLCHASSNGLSILLALAAHWSRKTPLLLSEHGIYLRERYLAYGAGSFSGAVRSIMMRFFTRLTWAGYQIASIIAPGSEYNRQWLVANGAAPGRIHPVYNGVDAANFVTSASEPTVPTLVWLGRIDPLKDVETLLRSFALVRETLPATRLRIFGTASPENQSYFERCMCLRDSLGLNDTATFEGRAESVVDAYHSGHVVLLTSISEGLPYTLIEAMAAGMPTVATDVGGVREVTGDAGLIVPPRDPQQMAAACIRLLTDQCLRQTIGREAKDRALSMFTLEKSLTLFRDLYSKATGRDPSAHALRKDQGPSHRDRGGQVSALGQRVHYSELPTASRAGTGVSDRRPSHRDRGALVSALGQRVHNSELPTASRAGTSSADGITNTRLQA